MVVARVLVGCTPTPQLLFEGCDAYQAERYGETCDAWHVDVVRIGPAYYMGDEPMEPMRHPAMPREGLSLAVKDRVGSPNLYYVVLPGRLDIYADCEFGDCRFKRSVRGTCCDDAAMP